MEYELNLPLSYEDVNMLRAGDRVRLSGNMYTARDAAHKLIAEDLENGKPPVANLEGACIFYAGPCPKAPGEVIGPCGPTTSMRMDAYAAALMDAGVNAMIGKGGLSERVINAMHGRAVYFAAAGGAAVFLADKVKEVMPVAYEELGTEAICMLKVENMPLVVAVDAQGGNLYKKIYYEQVF